MNREQIISGAYEVFSRFARPEHFTDYTHCEECAEHDETMRSRSLAEIGVRQVGNPGWSPIPFLTEEAFGYVMPRLLEMALSDGIADDADPFAFQYLLALTPSSEHREFDHFTAEQKGVVLESLYYMRDRMRAVIEKECCESNLSEAIALWETISASPPSVTPSGAP